ncbi:MAG TPA: DUF72 domain-containing protein [Terriglobales bacterium]
MPVANHQRKKQIGGSGIAKRPVDNPIRIGCAGWSIPRQFAGSFALTGSHLERYSQIFNCCEINSSFYRPHKNETWARWAATVPAGFQFSVKLPRTITHEAKLNCPPELLSAFLDQIKNLGEKLGPILVQLPPSLEFDRRIATKFLTTLCRRFSGVIVWEPRHATWFDADVDALLKDHCIARVAADPACVPAAADPSGASHLVYFRLHGSPRRYFSAYEPDYLNKLFLRMRDLARHARVWCIFDNTGFGAATANALELIAKGRQA